MARPGCSVIIPALNEAADITATLADLQPARQRGWELLLVDGGSVDDTPALAAPHCDAVLHSPPGRAVQLNAGAAAARGDWLWFVHADTRVPPAALAALAAVMVQPRWQWGRFDVCINGRPRLLRLVAALMNRRSRWTGIATGDQGIFVRSEVFRALGGYPPIPLMEDIALSRALRRRAWPHCLRARLGTSGRRWERHGVWRTIGLMWGLRLAYWLGVPPDRLARRYR